MTATRGGVVRFDGQDALSNGLPRLIGMKSAVIFDGVNLPVERGTVAFRIRWAGERKWADGRRTWLAVLCSLAYEEFGFKDPSEGTSLALIKEKDGHLILGIYQHYANKLTPGLSSASSGLDVAEPDAIPVSIFAGAKKPEDWSTIQIGWDQAAGRVWLSLDGELKTASVQFRKTRFAALLLGTPPNISKAENVSGFDGELDDLAISSLTPGQDSRAGLILPSLLPPVAEPKKVAAATAKFLADDPWGAKIELIARSHLTRVLEAQKVGGWAFSVAWPSMMRFLSSGAAIPYSDYFFSGTKDANSAGTAVRLLAAFEVLGEQSYLEAAEKTAETLLKIQHPAGCWSYWAVYRPDRSAFSIYMPDKGPFQDHVQSHPALLFYRLYDLTGKLKYKEAADKGIAFIARGQNPNGSWAHEYDIKNKVGITIGFRNGGENNDYATSDQMQIMLLAYRKTGAIR